MTTASSKKVKVNNLAWNAKDIIDMNKLGDLSCFHFEAAEFPFF